MMRTRRLGTIVLATATCLGFGLPQDVSSLAPAHSTSQRGTSRAQLTGNLAYAPCPVIMTGDANLNGSISASDIIYLVNSVFRAGPDPLPCKAAGDVNCSGNIASSDIIFLVNVVFRLGAAPCDVCTIVPSQWLCPLVVSDSVRVATLDSIEARLNLGDWAGLTQDSMAQVLLPFLESLPAIEAAGITPGTTTVWAHFQDGRMLVIPNNRPGGTDTLVAPVSIVNRSHRPHESQAPTLRPAGRPEVSSPFTAPAFPELPVSMQFRAWNAIGACHRNSALAVAYLLDVSDYTDIGSINPTVGNFLNIKEDGVFYLNTHGGLGLDKDSLPVMALWTTSLPTIANEANHKALLDNYELAYMIEASDLPAGGCGFIKHYGLTNAFIANQMSFLKNSLVYVDACYGADPGLADAFIAAGASAVVGWTKAVDDAFAYRTAHYLFDRLLGTNSIDPDEDPDQRPFDLASVMQDAQDVDGVNYLSDPWKGATLTVTRGEGNFGLLMPTIKFLGVDEYGSSSMLSISGSFGTDPGSSDRSVTMNGDPLTVLNWQPELIVCELPISGDQVSGTVIVEVGQSEGELPSLIKRKSNPVNLSSWEGYFYARRTEPDSAFLSFLMNIHFRADIHSFRELPGEDPFETLVLFSNSNKGQAVAGAGGTHTSALGGCLSTFIYGGVADLGSPFDFSPAGSWGYDGSIHTGTRELVLNLEGSALLEGGTWIMHGPVEEGCNNASFPWYFSAGIDGCLYDDVNVTQSFIIQLDPLFNIPEGERNCGNLVPAFGFFWPDGSTSQAKIRWAKITPEYPPDPRAPR